MQTSSDRDRYADFLRVLSIGLVVLGHWVAAVVLVRDEELVTGRLHALVAWAQWMTWVFQVMPVFFIVGGFVSVWGVVVTLGGITLTVYLWHMTAMILVAAFTYLTALWPDTVAIDATW